jgi:carbamoyl-phosphate synthase large subunit
MGLRFIGSPEEAQLNPPKASDIVQEKLEGREITVNVFYGRDGQVLYAIPHERIAVRSGEVSKGTTIDHPAVAAAAARMAKLLPGLWGPACFQAIMQADGSLGIFEINARFGGGYPLAHAAGARGPHYLLLDALGRTLQPVKTYTQGLTMLRYDQSVFGKARSAR